MEDNTMKTKTKHTKNQMNKYSTLIQTSPLQALCTKICTSVLQTRKLLLKQLDFHEAFVLQLPSNCGFNPRQKIT